MAEETEETTEIADAPPTLDALVEERIAEVVEAYEFTKARREGVEGAYEDLIERGEWPPHEVAVASGSVALEGAAKQIADEILGSCGALGIDLGKHAGKLHKRICTTLAAHG